MTDSCAAGGRRAQVPRPPRGCGRSPAARGARAGSRPRPGPREPARSSSSERLAPSRAAATSGGATPRRGRRGWPAATGGSPRSPSWPGRQGGRLPGAPARGCPGVSAAEVRGPLACRPARSPAPCRSRPGSYLRPAAIGRGARSAAAPPRQRRVGPLRPASLLPSFRGRGWERGAGMGVHPPQDRLCWVPAIWGRRTSLLRTGAGRRGWSGRASRKRRLLSCTLRNTGFH